MCGLLGPHISFGSLYIERGEDDMANLMLDFTKGFASGIAPQSLSELKSDAESIRDSIMGGVRTAQDKYREMRQSPLFKKTTDWFFRRGDEIGEGSSLNDQDDEFDAGFLSSSSGDDEDTQTKVLDFEGMKGIAKGQVSSMYHIAGKQTEASAMTASEIITTVNTRSSEILSSLGNINSSLQTISGKLDKLIELNTVATQERSRSQGLFDSSGNLTLGNTFRYVGQNIPYRTELEIVKSMGGMLGMMLDGSVMSRAEGFGTLSGMGIDLFADKRLKILDDQSINDIRNAIDERVSNAQNALLSKLLNWDKFKNLFGDLTRRESNKDYSTYIENQYNRDKAIFDNMTRKTIIDVIPGYLRRITAALTGETLYVSSEGSLTTERPKEFQNVFNSTMQAGFTDKQYRDIKKSADSDIDTNDIYMAQRVLVSLYVFDELRTKGRTTKGSDFENGGDPAINAEAVNYLSESGKSPAYWERVIKLFTTKLISDRSSREHFARTIRKTAMSTDQRAKRYAETATVTYDIGTISDDMVKSVVSGYISRSAGVDDRTWMERVRDGDIKRWQIPKGVDENSRPSDEEFKKARRQKIQQSELTGNSPTKSLRNISSLTTDYLASIFTLLNRGINVYSLRRKGQFDPIELVHVNVDTNPTPPSVLPKTEPEEPAEQAPVLGEINQGDGQPAGTGSNQPGQPTPASPFSQPLFQNVKTMVMNPIEKMRNNIRTDLTSLGAATIGTAGIDFNTVMAQRTMSKLGQSEDDKNDKAIADSVLAAMNASVQDGDTKEDVGPLVQQISNIKNQKLKAHLTKVVEGTLQRAETKKPAQSKIGKILTWALGIIKGFVIPKLQSAKTFITTLGKKLLSPIINSLTQSGQRIVGGATAIKEGLFGSDESIGLVGRAKESIANKKAAKEEIRLNNLRASLVDIDEQPSQKASSEMQKDIKKLVKDSEENKKGGFISKAMNNFVEKFKQTDFGKGFMSAFENRKNANKEMKPQSLSDQMTKSIFDILKSKDGHGSVFGTMISKITGIGDVFKEGINKLLGKENSTKSGSTMPDLNTGTTPNAASLIPLDAKPTGAANLAGNITGAAGTAGAATGATGAAASAAGAAAKTAGIGFDIGKMLGGMSGILMGLLQAVLTIIMSMKGFKMIAKLVMDVLKNSLKPLNTAFKSFYKAIKPVMKTVQKVLKQIVGYIVEIVESVIDIIQPLLEAIGPILEQMLDILKPILELVTGFVEKLAVPLTAIMQTLVVPILQTISNTLEITFGIIQVGFGRVIQGVGAIAMFLGFLLKMLGIGDLYDTGKQIYDTGTQQVEMGSQRVEHGWNSSVALAKENWSRLLGLDTNTETTETTENTETKRRTNVVDTLNGSPMDGLYGSGDLNSIYGGAGANQNRFGNYMNMNARGCGPVALADAYARRSGSAVNARGLTSAMASSGAYSPSMGTSVAGFMNASGSMGMNLRAGGVTPASLKQATPHNPITIVGSGTDFTTRKGNNHYMNVIGSSGGTAYVSNPMNGRVERRSITSLAANSLVGLYGSGDNVPYGPYASIYGSGDTSIYEFSDEVQDALSTLKDLVAGIIGIFTGDDSIEGSLEKEKSKYTYEQTMAQLGDMTDDEKAALEKQAFEEFKKENPRFEKETDAEYEKRFKTGSNGAYYRRYMTQAASKNLYEATKKQAGDYETMFNEELGEVDPETGKRTGGSSAEFLKSLADKDESIENGGFFSKLQEMIGDYWDEDYESGFYSDNGARLYTDEYEPTVFDTKDAVNWRRGKGDYFDAPLMEWLKYNMPTAANMSSAYRYYGANGADEEVVGIGGGNHNGSDFYDGGAETPIRSTTDGVVVFKGYEENGAGNYINIQDVGGDIHQYFHMKEQSPLEVGDTVYGGDIIGYVGNTGHSTGPHLHYQIKSEDGEIYNPHTFFKWYEGTRNGAPYGPIDYEGELEAGDIWNSHKDKTGVPKFMRTAFDAGLTGPEVATITSTGIWEDGGEKLWGDKSLLATTYDTNGQSARGIMNWVDPNVDYGDTVEEQLQYIQRVYFDGDSSDGRALVRDTGYDAQDLAAYNAVTGRHGWQLDYGDHYGPYMNEEDLIEGSEHFFRGALVPGCIHTTEGPRKYIGTAVGVYNWLLDEGYISEGGGRANIRYGSSSISSSYDPVSLTETEGFSTAAAATTAQTKNTTKYDKTDGTPYRYTSTNTGTEGTAYNQADQKLFDYYVPTHNTYADKHWIDKHGKYLKHMANFGGGKFVEIYIDENGFALTTAGNNAKALIKKYSSDKNIPKKTAQTQQSSVITTGLSDDDMRKIWKSIYTKYSNAYVNKLSREDMIADFNSGRATRNGNVLYYNSSDGNLYYKNNKAAGRIYVTSSGSIHWPDATIQTNNGTNVINNPNTSRSTTTTTVNQQLSRNREYAKQMNAWGGGDASYVMPMPYGSGSGFSGSLTDMFSIDPYMQEQQPVVVNNYDINSTGDGVIDALLTNTYNVRSVQIESLLTGMLQMMKDRKNQKTSSSKTRTSKRSNKDAAFPEQGIPRQVERLSIG